MHSITCFVMRRIRCDGEVQSGMSSIFRFGIGRPSMAMAWPLARRGGGERDALSHRHRALRPRIVPQPGKLLL